MDVKDDDSQVIKMPVSSKACNYDVLVVARKSNESVSIKVDLPLRSPEERRNEVGLYFAHINFSILSGCFVIDPIAKEFTHRVLDVNLSVALHEMRDHVDNIIKIAYGMLNAKEAKD